MASNSSGITAAPRDTNSTVAAFTFRSSARFSTSRRNFSCSSSWLTDPVNPPADELVNDPTGGGVVAPGNLVGGGVAVGNGLGCGNAGGGVAVTDGGGVTATGFGGAAGAWVAGAAFFAGGSGRGGSF